MNLQEFESQSKSTIEQSLNQLQTAVLLLARLESRIISVGQELQNLSQILEDFINAQKAD